MRVLLASHAANPTTLQNGLADHGCVCDTAEGLQDLASVLSLSGPYDMVILDVATPDREVQAAVRGLRREGCVHPVIILCARPDAMAEEAILHAGADDVVLHPVRLPVLHARMQALMRRARGYASARLACGNVTLDQEQHAVTVDGRRVPLTAREFDFLQTLMLHKGVLLTKERFMSSLYADSEAPDLKIVDVFVCKLRRKLAACGAAEMIRTVWGRGHVLFEPSADAVAAAREALLPDMAEPAPRGWVRRAGLVAAGA
ncbi:response regulator transcription factor [Siccirubricoccus sp. G192]|uniref:winged helix-turn-helix domain-containing protein n=1 Tax=Siccirubricoccus sp. G192 TaxID=2849651 RepID=UPI001C2C9D29|nr:response regulator transcription factor [Siccirubricoccus sp. G192]MBV1798394.1 response regulator transcription factor [Siccirubricoccus sp. G192]